jgi:hypothetical protein
VCFYDVELGAVGTAKASWTKQTERLASALSAVSGSQKSVVVVSSRSIVVVTQAYNHRRIRSIWPDLACIGQSGGDASGRRHEICTKYIRESVKAAEKGSEIPSDLPQPTCQTFLD